jgi:amino acid adenylation domain-containing protein
MTNRNYPLSSPQREVWFEQLAHPNIPLYNLGGYMRLAGTIDPVLFEQAVQVLVKRHDALHIRLTGSDKDEMPLLRIAESSVVEIPFYDLSKQADPHQAALEWMKQVLVQPFDLRSDHLLFRYALIKVHDRLFYWFQTYHHLIIDSWGIALLTKELGKIYTALVRGEPVHSTDVPSYLSFVEDDRYYIDSPKYSYHRQYWLSKYTDMPEPLFTPRFSGQFGASLSSSRCHSVDLPRSRYDRVIMFAKQQGVSTFHLILGALYVYFTRTQQRDDLAVGLSILNRSNARFKQTVGLFTKVFPVWFRWGRQLSFAKLLQAIKDELTKNHEDHYERFPINDLNRSISQHKTKIKQLFDLRLSYQNHDYTSTFDTIPSEMHFLSNDLEPSPLHIYVREFYANKPVTLDFFYNLAYFKVDEIERIQASFVHILESVIEISGQSIATLPLLTETEIAQLKNWNATETDYPKNQTIIDLFQTQVEKTPNNIAVVFENQQLTYQQLNEKANQLAHHLLTIKNQAEMPNNPLIAIAVERSLEMVIGLLGILKAGGAYVPIDPSYPTARIHYMLEDSATPLLLTQSHLKIQLLSVKPNCVTVCLDEVNVVSQPLVNPDINRQATDLAYVIYTSGSTGKPKGVSLPQIALVNLLHWQSQQTGLDKTEKTLQFTTLSFDVSFQEIFSTFLTGGQLLLVDEETRRDATALIKYLLNYQVERLFVPYPMLQHLAQQMAVYHFEPPQLQNIITAGEQLRITPEIETLFKKLPHSRLHNHYGPTESHVVTAFTLPLDQKTWTPLPPIGQPIANTRIYILDAQHQLLPPGIPGELCIAGRGLAHGYINRPELTAKKFVEVELFGKTERIYKTGDLARWLSDGNLEYIGRIDHQVKLRGFRIELGEIETILVQHPAVREAIVISIEEKDDDKRLVAYVLPEEQSVESQTSSKSQNNLLLEQVAQWLEPKLRAHLAASLPDYMIPAAFVMLDVMPLTPNGKIDRSALPAPDPIRPQLETALVMPQSETEQLLATIWQETLQLEIVGIHDNFFELGGHSLLLTLVHNKLVPIFGQKLSIVAMFQHPTIHTLAKYLSQFSTDKNGQISSQQATLNRKRKTKVTHEDTDIAIIGMSCRFPGANNLDTFWQNLRDGVEAIAFFSDEELEVSDPRLLSHPHYVKACPILSEVELFDASFFDYSAKEAEIMDPQQRLFLECAWEAFENAGVNLKTYEGLVGVYAGSGMNAYLINNVHPNRDFSPNRTFLDSASDLQVRLGNDRDHIATRISYKLNLKGPSVNIQTACSTALAAIHLACQGLQTGECEIALAGCMNIILPQKTGYLYQEDMIFSPDGHCRAFDAKAQGTLFGNGGGAVILKLLSKAIADGDDIYAVIKGSAVNNDGSVKVGYTAPSVDGQAAVICDALSVADIDASTISYVEAHGTGTPLGDPIEIAALTQAFHANTEKENLDRKTCAIGSVKTNLGHLTEAAGLAGLIKTVLALQAQLIPPTLHFTEPNPNIDFESGPFYVNTELSEWKANEFPRRAGVSAFGMGGTNAHLVLEEAPRREKVKKEEEDNGATSLVAKRSCHILTLSAKNDQALKELSQRYKTYLDHHPDISLADLCYTTNIGRQHFSHRLAIVSSSTRQLREQLIAFLQGTPQIAGVVTGWVDSRHSPKKSLPSEQSLSKGKVIAFLLTGQGSQYVDMGRTLYETQPLFREVLEKCDEILAPLLGHSLLKLLYSPAANESSLLDQTAYTQPALFALEYALTELWKSWGIEPDVVMGHSVGEYVAACVAGVFSLEEGLKLIAERGRLVQALPPGGEMVAVMASEAQVVNAIRSVALSHQSKISIAAINGPENIVISGLQPAVRAVSAALEVQGVKTKYLKVSHAFHSPLMEPILDAFHTIARQVSFSTPRIKFISNVTGKLATEQVAAPEYWCRHIREPVQFAAGMASLAQLGVNMFVEIGPKPALLGMGHQCLPDSDGLWLPSLHPKRDDWQQLLTSLASAYVHGVDISWSGFVPEHAEKYQRLHLPTYPFQRKRYWIEPATTRSLLPEPREQSHPLLGQQLYLAGTSEIRFESQISRKTLAFLANSDAVQHIPLPMAAYLEMALVAGAKVFKSDQITVEDVFIQQPLFLFEHEITILQFVLKPTSHSTESSNPQTVRWASFEIYSLTHENSESVWTLHAVGSLLRQGGPNVASPARHSLAQPQNLEILPAQCNEVPVNLFYQQASIYGFDGLNLQNIKQLWYSEEPESQSRHTASHLSTLGQVCLPDELLPHDYHFHPALLDACLQVSVAAFLHGGQFFGDGEQSNAYMPMSVEHLMLFIPAFKLRELCNTSTQNLWSHAQICPTSNQELLTADVHIFDESGKPVALVAGFSMKRTTRDARQPREILPNLVASPTEKPEQADLLPKLANTPVKERWNLLATEVRVVVGQVLGTASSGDSSEWLALQQGFFDYGMDSFTSIELRNRLQSRLGCNLPTTLAFKYSSIESLVNYLASEVLSLEFTLPSEVEPPTNAPADNDEAMERKVHELSESEAEAWLLKELEAMD